MGQIGPILMVKEWWRKSEIRMENQNADHTKKQTQKDDIRRDIVDRQCKPPDRQHRSEVTEHKRTDCPHGAAVGQGFAQNLVRRGNGSEPYSAHGDDDRDDRRQDDVLLPAIDHLPGQDPPDRKEEPGHGGRFQSDGGAHHHVPESSSNQEQVKINEGRRITRARGEISR